ncbi:hypothetical protein MMC34_004898 [Xylographa carneopallida]|nr:hypothetical protein [Xylographa carneopallida]
MLQFLTSLLSLAALSLATSANPPPEATDLHPHPQLSRRTPSRRVYLELDLQLSHAIIQDYRGTPIGPAVLALYVEADGGRNPSIKIDIRVLDYNSGVVLPTPYVEETAFPFIFAREEQTAAFVTHGPGIEIYPLGRTALHNDDIMNVWTGKGRLVDVLKIHPAINERQDANSVILYMANELYLQRESVHADLGRVMQFVRGSRQWYADNGVRFYCEMPLLTYRSRAFKRTFNIEMPDAPVILFGNEVRDFIRSIAHKVVPPPPFGFLPASNNGNLGE